jgi:uncharacterized protein YigE (DUF2233 family)
MTVNHFNKLMLPISILAISFVLFAASGPKPAPEIGKVINYQGAEYTVFTADPAKHQLTLHWKNADGRLHSSIGNLLKAENGKKIVMITNAGMYTPTQAPVGLYIEKGNKMIPLNTNECDGNFCLKPNGVLYLDRGGPHVTATENYLRETIGKQVHYATQSGPMLVIDGKVHPAFNVKSTSFYIRSGVGIDSIGNVVFAISNQPVNFHSFAMLFKDVFECKNALYLDGAISLMYLPNIRDDRGGKFGPMISVSELP